MLRIITVLIGVLNFLDMCLPKLKKTLKAEKALGKYEKNQRTTLKIFYLQENPEKSGSTKYCKYGDKVKKIVLVVAS